MLEAATRVERPFHADFEPEASDRSPIWRQLLANGVTTILKVKLVVDEGDPRIRKSDAGKSSEA